MSEESDPYSQDETPQEEPLDSLNGRLPNLKEVPSPEEEDNELTSGFDLEPDEDSSQTLGSNPRLNDEPLVVNLFKQLMALEVWKQVDEIMEGCVGSTQGEITFFRVQQHYQNIGDFRTCEKDIKQFIKSYDPHNTGRVTRTALYTQLEQQMVDAKAEQISEVEASLRTRSNEAFNEADIDGDGFLTSHELDSFLLRVEAELGSDYAKEVRDAADKHKGISAEEFYRVIFKMEKDNVAAEL